MKKLFIGGLAAIALYTVIPTMIGKTASIGIRQKGNLPNTLALTFDDGPNPLYTPQLLDLLKMHDISATFFVVGEKAAAYPDLIRRMHEEGHEIGVHHFRHISNWLLSPSAYRRQLTKSIQVISGITGERPSYYRPPWGHFNLCSLFFREQLQVIMWSHIPRDWKKGITEAELYSRLDEAGGDGDFILLHDCGETFGADREAPAVMLRALEPFILDRKEKGIRFLTVTPLAGTEHLEKGAVEWYSEF
ncbi:polysaccharide deacetylase family protein [Planococcus lenghuensis]|uniref:NodB homology domain-containing protein n=1 Tax=Planococcus lenghuensis TaxID=2213202 RepID=A0A1Q2L466_9BACL|nr:polysaccharide deacetylase family protein [Planococcus lenghuensis]AQQ55213.1 hypothetical protein B0X71_18335 [Planococcus lenghuensis]